VNVERLQVDLLTIAGHKIYAPKGVGSILERELQFTTLSTEQDRRWEGGLVLKMSHTL